MALDLSLLPIFVAVAEGGSLTAGASALRMQQSTVSRAIAQLERELGAPLFERRARGVVLTPKGHAVLERCAPHLEALERGVMSALAEPEAPGILAFGAAEVIVNTVGVEVTRRLARRQPHLVPYALVAPADVLAERVRRGALEFALVMHVRSARGLGVRSLRELRHQLVVARGFEKDRRVLARFIGSREVEDPQNRQFPTLEKLRAIVPEAAISASSNSLLLHKQMVLAGLGVSILPELLVADELATGQLVPLLTEHTFAFPVLLVSRAATVWTAPARAFLAELEAVLAEY